MDDKGTKENKIQNANFRRVKITFSKITENHSLNSYLSHTSKTFQTLIPPFFLINNLPLQSLLTTFLTLDFTRS